MELAKLIANFSEKCWLSLKTATKIIEKLYAKGLDYTQLSSVKRRLETYIVQNKMEEIVDDMDESTIDAIINDVFVAEWMNTNNTGTLCCSNDRGKVWQFYEFAEKAKEYKAGDTVDIQIMRKWTWEHSIYGTIDVNSQIIDMVKAWFDDNKRWVDIAVDEDHDTNHKALGWFRKLYKKGKDALYATIELTVAGADMLSKWYYKYFSPEIVFNYTDEETGEYIPVILTGWAFTNRPFFKAMQPIMASEWDLDMHDNGDSNPSSYIFISTNTHMFEFAEMIAKLSQKERITKDEKVALEAKFSEVANDVNKDRKLVTRYNMVLAKFNEDDGEGLDEENAADTVEEPVADAGEEPKAAEGEGDEEGKADEAAPAEWEEPKADDAGTPETPAEGEPKTVEANEAMVTVKASEFKNLQTMVSKLARENRINATTAKVTGMLFSETNKQSVVLPANLQSIVNFAVSLSEQQEVKFLEIIWGLKAGDARLFGEIGDTGKPSTPTVFSEAAYNDLVAAKVKEGMTAKEARKAATAYFAEAAKTEKK